MKSVTGENYIVRHLKHENNEDATIAATSSRQRIRQAAVAVGEGQAVRHRFAVAGEGAQKVGSAPLRLHAPSPFKITPTAFTEDTLYRCCAARRRAHLFTLALRRLAIAHTSRRGVYRGRAAGSGRRRHVARAVRQVMSTPRSQAVANALAATPPHIIPRVQSGMAPAVSATSSEYAYSSRPYALSRPRPPATFIGCSQ